MSIDTVARKPGHRPSHRGVSYSTMQEPTGAWRWKVLPANQLHAYDFAIPSGYCATREAADAAARAAIDAQFDS